MKIRMALSRVLVVLAVMVMINCFQPDNACTFRINSKLYSLLPISSDIYEINKGDTKIVFSFCKPIIPPECDSPNMRPSFSFVINSKGNDSVECLRYSSDTALHNFEAQAEKTAGQTALILDLITEPGHNQTRQTSFRITCDDQRELDVLMSDVTDSKLTIFGKSNSGCPVFEITGIWSALEDSKWLFGAILVILGFQLLFFGLLMIYVTIFIAGYFLAFAVLGALTTTFLTPQSSMIVVYFTLLGVLFCSTLAAYGLTRLVRFSIFIVGAFMGFVLGALFNSIFCKMVGVYSVWSLVFFQIAFTIPLGLLTFKYSEQIIILSTSLTGAYMFVRPISWVFGGFPNEFTLYQMIESKAIATLPWTFFLYIALILVIAILGAFYQLLKAQRRDPTSAVEVNFIQEQIEAPIDKIKETVQRLINKYSDQEPQYNLMEPDNRNSGKSSKSNLDRNRGIS